MIFVLLFCVFVFLPTAYCALDGITAKQCIRRCELENYTGIDKQCIIAARVVSK